MPEDAAPIAYDFEKVRAARCCEQTSGSNEYYRRLRREQQRQWKCTSSRRCSDRVESFFANVKINVKYYYFVSYIKSTCSENKL